MGSKPVLIVGFNRPDLVRQVVDQVREYRPSTVYLACDGARPELEGEEALVRQVRKELQKIDWPCNVHKKFEGSNLGLRDSMVQAIDWMFRQEPEGIILEDDCVPSRDFFRLMEFILETYRGDARVWGATGSNPLNMTGDPQSTLSFVGTALIWGWATWADRWQRYDRNLEKYNRSGWRRKVSRWQDKYTFHALDWQLNRLSEEQRPHTWDYQWAWSVAYHGGLWGVPHQNLITNIGFGPDATHTKDTPRGNQVIGTLGEIKPPKAPTRNIRFQRELHRKLHRVLRPLPLNRIRDLIRALRLVVKPFLIQSLSRQKRMGPSNRRKLPLN